VSPPADGEQTGRRRPAEEPEVPAPGAEPAGDPAAEPDGDPVAAEAEEPAGAAGEPAAGEAVPASEYAEEAVPEGEAAGEYAAEEAEPAYEYAEEAVPEAEPAGEYAAEEAEPAYPPAGLPAAARAAAGGDLYERLWESGLLNVGTIAGRGVGPLLRSPVVYVLGALAVGLTSVLGYLSQLTAGQPVSMTGVFNSLAVVMALCTPLLTMRLLADERRSGILDQLLTAPVRLWEVVVGKWLAGLAVYGAAIALTLVYVALITAYQHRSTPTDLLGLRLSLPAVDYGAVLTGYAGALLVGAAWVALGLLASSLTRSRFVAAVGGMALLLALQYLGAVGGSLSPPLSDLLAYAGTANRVQSFNQGQVMLRDVAYFVTLTAGALFLTARVIESTRWR
jgi:ABC-2 type transport system permease protein